MATEDGLTMTLHPGVRRHHHRPSCVAFGGDTGPDGRADHAEPQLGADVVTSVADRARGLGAR